MYSVMLKEDTLDWQTIVFESGWLSRLDRLAEKRFGQGGLAEEASSYVIEKLSANDWASLCAFKGQSKPETYLYTITGNYLEEFSRKRFGRPRPPEWLKRQGDFWVTTWKMLCLERQSESFLVEKLCGQEIRDPDEIKAILRTIKARLPWCGHSNKEIPVSSNDYDEDSQSLEQIIPDHLTPELALSKDLLSETLIMMSVLLNDRPNPEKLVDGYDFDGFHIKQDMLEKLIRFKQTISLDDQERIILRMVFQDGFKRKAVAKSLGLQDHVPGRIITKALEKIKLVLESIDFKFDEISHLVD